MSYAKIQTFLTKFNLENLENSWGGVNLSANLLKISNMSKFYILMVILLVIAIINLVRVFKEKTYKSKVWGTTINTIAILLIAIAIIISFIQ